MVKSRIISLFNESKNFRVEAKNFKRHLSTRYIFIITLIPQFSKGSKSSSIRSKAIIFKLISLLSLANSPFLSTNYPQPRNLRCNLVHHRRAPPCICTRWYRQGQRHRETALRISIHRFWRGTIAPVKSSHSSVARWSDPSLADLPSKFHRRCFEFSARNQVAGREGSSRELAVYIPRKALEHR